MGSEWPVATQRPLLFMLLCEEDGLIGLETVKTPPNQDGVDALTELALNLHWSWNHSADELWEELDKELWAATQNPWVILQTVSKDKISASLAEQVFRQRLDDLLHQNRKSYQADAWFQHKHPDKALTTIAYFSMEFMLSEALRSEERRVGKECRSRWS